MSYYLLDEEKIQAFLITRIILSFEKFCNSFKKLVNQLSWWSSSVTYALLYLLEWLKYDKFRGPPNLP